MLASSAVGAQRGEYEPARQEASDFYTALREQLDKADDDAALTPQQRDNLRPLLKERDDVITLLARSDPAAGPRLLDAHATFRKAILSAAGGPEGPIINFAAAFTDHPHINASSSFVNP